MHHDIQKIISCHNFYLFFPIGKWKEFKVFQLIESFKKKCANAPSIYQEIYDLLKCISILSRCLVTSFGYRLGCIAWAADLRLIRRAAVLSRGHSQTTLTRFCPLLTIYLPHPLLTYSYCHKVKSLYTVDISSTIYLPRQVNVVKKFPSSSLFLGAPRCQKCELWQIAKGIWAKVKPSASVKLSIRLHEKFNFVSRVPLETASHLLVHSSRAKHGKVWKWHSYVSSVYQRVYQSVFILSPIFKSLWENQTRIYFGSIVISM